MLVMTRCGYPEINADKIKRVFIAYNKKEIIEKDFEFLADFCKGNKIHKNMAKLEKSFYNRECSFIGKIWLEDD